MQNYIMELYVPLANRFRKMFIFSIYYAYLLILNTVANLIKRCRFIVVLYDKLKFYYIDITYYREYSFICLPRLR